MISVVLYGRNDNYGYNLHKRAALGLNCMAEVLTDADDEILFVDYNTPDDHPTFPEAIADTLTPRAAALLRILRVRPDVHARFRPRTHLKALEPVARNVAVRRSNPRNRWILSTNTDMIFVPRRTDSLSTIAAALPAGFYHLPRFELPESLWEGFDRRDPRGVIREVRTLGRTMFLNEIVYGVETIKYDAPGDFQLIARDDLFRIHGFNEDMLLGWHVDSNIAKRLYLVYGVVGDLVAHVFGYHCDHTRQVTPAHEQHAPSNSIREFFDEVATPFVPAQAGTWGCPNDAIEEVRLDASASTGYRGSLAAVLEGEWTEPAEAWFTPATFGKTTYDPRHVLPFLADVFAASPRAWSVGWVGGRADTLRMFCAIWRHLGFRGDVLIDPWAAPLLAAPAAPPGATVVPARDIDARADALVFDFGAPSEAAAAGPLDVDPRRLDEAVDTLLRERFRAFAEAERRRVRGGREPRRFVCVDAVHNLYETLVRDHITAASTPFAARLRQGFVATTTLQDEWSETPAREVLGDVHVGACGVRTESGITATPGQRGYLFTGPDLVLPPGDYIAEVSFRPRTLRTLVAFVRPVVLEVVAGSECLRQVRLHRLFGTAVMPFSISQACYDRKGVTDIRLLRGRSVEFAVSSVKITQLRPTPAPVLGDADDGPLAALLGHAGDRTSASTAAP